MENANPNQNGNVYTVRRHSTPNDAPTASLDNLVQISSRSSIFKKRNFYKKVSLALLVLVVILLIAFIIALYDYLRTWAEVKGLRERVTCNSEECVRSAASLKLSMDVSADPCEDFYKFSCGRWTEEHPNHGWYPHFSSFETIDERIAIAALGLFQANASTNEPVPVRQSRDLYFSCMDTDALDRLGYSVIISYLKEVELPLVPNYFNASRSVNFTFDWIKTEVTLKKTFAMDTLIGLLVDADIYNRSNSVIYMGTPGTSCPLPSPIKSENKPKPTKRASATSDAEEKAKEEAYKRIVKEVIRVISLNVSNEVPDDVLLENAASSIWNITKDLEENDSHFGIIGLEEGGSVVWPARSFDLTPLADTNTTTYDIQFYKMKVDDLQNITDQFLRHNNATPVLLWRRYLTLMFEGVPLPNITLDLDSTDQVYVPIEELAYFPELALYLQTVPDLILELYMWWITVYAMILSTTSEMGDFIAKESVPFTRVGVYRSRSLDCASLVINFMGLAVSYGISDKTFLNNTKPKVEQMLNDIKDAFVERVVDLRWMDAETKKVTLEKTKEMISFIGFPEWLLDRVSLENYYSNLTMDNDTFLENMMGLIKTSTSTKLATLRQESERTWRTDPTTVNAYNYFSDNSITVPMAILTHPFYNLGLECLNYGAIGSVLGHELTHGFDNIGRKFDKYGNYQQWWSNKTIETFENKTECFVYQYGNFTLPPIEDNINGKQTLGENLADNGGLHHAFLAYKNYIKRHGQERKLPGFETFTNMQMFFIAFGSIWCETPNVEALKYQIENDEHCPSSVRVLGTLQNSHEFAEAFKCPIGSKMNPNKTRCRIW